MTRTASALALVALVTALPLAAQEARDFQLPPGPTATGDSRTQGPVDNDAPLATRPRTIATPTPTASDSPAPVQQPAPAPPAEPSLAPATPASRPAASGNGAGATIAPRAVPVPATAAPAGSGAGAILAAHSALPDATATRAPVPDTPSASAPAIAETTGAVSIDWRIIALALGASATALAGWLAWRRRRAAVVFPVVDEPAPARAATPPLGQHLALRLEAVRMDRSLMNVTVGYRATLLNQGGEAVTGIALEADLVSARGDLPAGQQLAAPDHPLAHVHALDRLAPGQSAVFEGQVRLPLAEVHAVRQGSVQLLVPLLRMRALANQTLPLAVTLVVGPGTGVRARPQPFRLDEPPRSYAPLAQRVLDPVAAQA